MWVWYLKHARVDNPHSQVNPTSCNQQFKLFVYFIRKAFTSYGEAPSDYNWINCSIKTVSGRYYRPSFRFHNLFKSQNSENKPTQ